MLLSIPQLSFASASLFGLPEHRAFAHCTALVLMYRNGEDKRIPKVVLIRRPRDCVRVPPFHTSGREVHGDARRRDAVAALVEGDRRLRLRRRRRRSARRRGALALDALLLRAGLPVRIIALASAIAIAPVVFVRNWPLVFHKR